MPADRSAWPTCAAAAPASKLSGLDLVLVVDTTGSMGGVINDIRSNIYQLISNLQAGAGDVRMGIVAYRDMGDDYVVRPFPLTELNGGGAAALSAFAGALRANGGGDWPERMDAALQAAAAMKWRRGLPGSIVVIADAPAHGANTGKAISSARDFAGRRSGAQVSLVDTGSGGNPFMREVPAAGGGQYVTYDGDILKSLYPAITGCASK